MKLIAVRITISPRQLCALKKRQKAESEGSGCDDRDWRVAHQVVDELIYAAGQQLKVMKVAKEYTATKKVRR